MKENDRFHRDMEAAVEGRRTMGVAWITASRVALALGWLANSAFAQSTGEPPARLPAAAAAPLAEDVHRAESVSGATAAEQPSDVRHTAADEPAAKLPAGETAPSATGVPTSDAERISRLERAVEDGAKRLAQLRECLADPQGEFAQAEAEFTKLDASLEEARQALHEATQEGVAAEIAAARQTVLDLEPAWNRAKERFEIALRERRTLKENIAIIEQKLESDRQASNKLRGLEQEANPPASDQAAVVNAAPSIPAGPADAAPPVAATESGAPSAGSQALGGNGQTASGPAPLIPMPLAARATSDALSDASAAATATPNNQQSQKAPSKELAEAQQEAEKSAAEADAAEKEVRSISDRIAILQKSINVERDLRDAVRNKVDHAEETLRALDAELFEKLVRGDDARHLRLKSNDAKERLREYREEARRISTQLDKLQSELGSLQAEQLGAFEQAEAKRSIADAAQQKVKRLNNPFTARNLMQWSLNHGPKILAILFATATLLWISRIVQSRLVQLMAVHARRGKREDRENRAKTLVSVFHNAANLLIVGGGAIMLLDEIGIPIGPLVGGAAVVGLAVAFGAQSLIKDYFTGFILLLEQQYLINDVIRIGDIAGQVERITLRMTVLRDLEGRVHFIPHGEIHSVTNFTHGWSRALVDVGVAYKENVDHVIEVLSELGHGLRRDEQFGKLILEDLTMLGVDALGDSAVVIKLFIKTKPLQQWAIKREFLRRVKNRFDELGIEIPFPHRTVYQRQGLIADDSDGESGHRDGEGWSQQDAA